jgi:hypothetical protein
MHPYIQIWYSEDYITLLQEVDGEEKFEWVASPASVVISVVPVRWYW